MTNMAANKNAIIDKLNLCKGKNRKVVDIRLEEKRMGVTLLFEADQEEFIKIDAPNSLHIVWLRNEAAAYSATINNGGRKGA